MIDSRSKGLFVVAVLASAIMAVAVGTGCDGGVTDSQTPTQAVTMLEPSEVVDARLVPTKGSDGDGLASTNDGSAWEPIAGVGPVATVIANETVVAEWMATVEAVQTIVASDTRRAPFKAYYTAVGGTDPSNTTAAWAAYSGRTKLGAVANVCDPNTDMIRVSVVDSDPDLVSDGRNISYELGGIKIGGSIFISGNYPGPTGWAFFKVTASPVLTAAYMDIPVTCFTAAGDPIQNQDNVLFDIEPEKMQVASDDVYGLLPIAVSTPTLQSDFELADRLRMNGNEEVAGSTVRDEIQPPSEHVDIIGYTIAGMRALRNVSHFHNTNGPRVRMSIAPRSVAHFSPIAFRDQSR